jgi:hypothetical protein
VGVVTEGEVGGVEMLRAGAWGWLNLGGKERLERVCFFLTGSGARRREGCFHLWASAVAGTLEV